MMQNSLSKPSKDTSLNSNARSSVASSLAEPVAIVGMACRFPGAPDISTFWNLLKEGENAVTEGVPGSSPKRLEELFSDPENLRNACRFCAYVDEIDLFDAGFFRISPVEADMLDPQQRMMLEVSWQALEDAGIDPEQLMESRTGVYCGISNDEYRMLVVDSEKLSEAAESLYALSGTNLNGTSGRVSFVLGLRGPAKAVDAACASSLVSVHDAVADLQQGKADLAIAGGVQAILNSRIFELRAKSMMLSPDGQCKAFDASANGYVRGEGCGVVVLKRLKEAEADNDRIWAVIRGAAVNHGGASIGLTVPNEPALEQVIEEAMSQAGISASEVDYLEAHGTGTAVGDPIEINAVARVYGPDREPERPLLIGSVKTNIGHLESAAGIAGLMKAALVLRFGIIPQHLHFNDPTPSVDWDQLPLQITSSMMDLPARNGRARLAGVNSFGISGTNAHILVEEYVSADSTSNDPSDVADAGQAVQVSLPQAARSTQQAQSQLQPRIFRVLPVSGKSDQALRDLANRYMTWLDEQVSTMNGETIESLLSNMAWTAGVGRSHFDYRQAIVFNNAEQLREKLAALVGAGSIESVRAPQKVAFVYTGQGSQWTGMGQDLYESEPLARSVFDRCEEVFVAVRGTSLLDVMFGRTEEAELNDTAWEQPALYALECALTALWSSIGIQPCAVLGHSVGEIAAAQAAGAFSLEDGMRFAATRGTLLSETAAGAMAAVFAPPTKVAATLEILNETAPELSVNISAYNGSHQVISGPVAGIETVVKQFEEENIRVRRLNTNKAFHSELVEPVLDALEASLDNVAFESPGLTVISNVTGQEVEEGQLLDGAYWRRHVRAPVAFAQSVNTLADLGVDLIVELGPRSVLAPMAASAWPNSASPPKVLSSIHLPAASNASEGRNCFAAAVAEAYNTGMPIRFAGLFSGETRHRISVPGYPFQRQPYWLPISKKRRSDSDHPLLGTRRESASGEVTFETELFSSDPKWLNDHRVFDRVIAPGAIYGTMAASLFHASDGNSVVVEDMQLHNPLLFPEDDDDSGRKVQVVAGTSGDETADLVRIFSKGMSEDEWTLHTECRVPPGGGTPPAVEPVNIDSLKRELSPVDAGTLYSARRASGVDLGPSFRTLGKIWVRPGESIGEVLLPEAVRNERLDFHPLVLDGCFQVVAAARIQASTEDKTTYLPFGWERLWLSTGSLPDRVLCHVLMKSSNDASTGPAEVLSADLRIYSDDGVLLGCLDGYTIKRATRAALLSTVEGINDLLYEVIWRQHALAQAIIAADFLPEPDVVSSGIVPLADYLHEEGVSRAERSALLTDLEQWACSRALWTLKVLGWQCKAGEVVEPDSLRHQLSVIDDHKRLFRRLLEMLERSGVLATKGDAFVVKIADGDPLPDELTDDPDAVSERLAEIHPHGATEIGLFGRCGAALPEVLKGRMDPLTLLFSSGYPTPADLYLKAPIALAANRMLKDVVAALLDHLPADRRLHVIEVGAGTGSATASVLPLLPEGRYEYMYTDISAGFFAEAESRFGDGGGCIHYRPLDIEKDPIDQGFDGHAYDLIIASNVLHATRSLNETLDHCLRLLAPSGQMVALENLRGQGWMDLTFGQLDGWWRFNDEYRQHHALASPEIWRRALNDAGFSAVEVVGLDASNPSEMPDRGVLLAGGPTQVTEPPGTWLVVDDEGGNANQLSNSLAARNQTVLLVTDGLSETDALDDTDAGVFKASVKFEQREAWESVLKNLPDAIPFKGIVQLAALNCHGAESSTAQMAQDVKRVCESSLAMVQGLIDSDMVPTNGVWFITRGAQILEREASGALAGASLWGLGKAVAREAAHLQLRMIDLDPKPMDQMPDFVDELMYPDIENHIAYREDTRQVARLIRYGSGPERLELPDDSTWVLTPDSAGLFEKPRVMQLPARPLESREVQVAVEAAGLNFWDVFRSLGFIEEGNLGREMCGYVVGVGSEVSDVCVGDHIVGLGFGAFAAQMITHEELVAAAPDDIAVAALATIPSAFVSAALSYELSGLEADDRVLIHAGAGGVGIAAIQLAQASGAEVFATASAPKQSYLRSLGVRHIFDSRQTAFGEEILEATDGAGVTVVLNSLTSEGFIDASLSCLAQGGRFIELARRDILSEEEMAALRPDVSYAILELDVLKKTDPEWVGRVLRGVMERISTGELKPIIHSRWPLAEAGAALRFMRSARHLGKIVVTAPPLLNDHLRQDRTYLVTGGLGGIGLAVAEWLVERGAGTIVLNGRRPPDDNAQAAIQALEERGATIQVELADVSDSNAVDAMLARTDAQLPALAGIIHSVGVLSDGALPNQSWDKFETVLWPKILGAWQLHRATTDRDLDLFVLFSSRVGVMGNPGQANHAAANAFLDQLAGYRRALGLPGQAIAWGAWSEIGEAAEQKDRIERQRSALGGRWFTPQQGIRAFNKLVSQDITNSVVMAMDWAVFEEAVEEPPPFLEDLLSSVSEDQAAVEVSSDELLSILGNANAVEREELLVSFLQQELQSVLRLSSTPAPDVGFFDLGMDSLMAVEFRNRLNRALAEVCTVSNTVVFDYPDINVLARHLDDEIGEVEAAEAPKSVLQLQPVPQAEPAPQLKPTEEPAAHISRDQEHIAIIGMACRFPGAPDLTAYWKLLEAGADLVTDGRRDAGPWSGLVGDPAAEDSANRRGGFIEELDRFDADFFGIRPIEARMMDPRQRMLLETSWHALEDAGIDPGPLKASHAGVFAGLGSSEYRDLIAATGKEDSYLGTAASVAIGRIAYVLGLMGPAIPLDMTCASSLVAVHQAAASLRNGEVDLALAGGVHAILSTPVMQFMKDYGMLGRTGQCRTFDAGADGFVRGEGCGMVVLKRLSDAQATGDRILGVLRASAINQNGAAAALTVPNGTAQERLFAQTLSQAGIAPREVDYLEVHGTGSQLGDPIEVQAAAEVYGKGRDIEKPLLLGTVKTNIGHLESAAGVAGLIKVLLAMQHGVIPKHLHFENPSPEIDWNKLPVRVTSEATVWPVAADRPPIAGVSAFGISGTNAHLLVQGYTNNKNKSTELSSGHSPEQNALPVPVCLPEGVRGTPQANTSSASHRMRFLPLSGKSEDALRELAQRYLNWLDLQSEEIATDEDQASSLLADMAWTAGIGRSHFAYRASVLFEDATTLRSGLLSVLENKEITPLKPTGKLAFNYAGADLNCNGLIQHLYESEPVIRAVVTHCDSVLHDEYGTRLLDVSNRGIANPDGSVLTHGAVYSLQSALTALWRSVGISPNMVCGYGLGEIATAQAAGVVSIDAGVMLATRLAELTGTNGESSAGSNLKQLLRDVSLKPPHTRMVAGLSGRTIEPGETLDQDDWGTSLLGSATHSKGSESFSDQNVDKVVAIGFDTPFVETVAGLYEAGFVIDFSGLFAGEMRSRISLPGYPFQRRAFWFND